MRCRRDETLEINYIGGTLDEKKMKEFSSTFFMSLFDKNCQTFILNFQLMFTVLIYCLYSCASQTPYLTAVPCLLSWCWRQWSVMFLYLQPGQQLRQPFCIPPTFSFHPCTSIFVFLSLWYLLPLLLNNIFKASPSQCVAKVPELPSSYGGHQLYRCACYLQNC